MRSKSRVLIVATAAVVPLFLVTACGGGGTDAGPSNNLTPITGSSYVTIEPATTTTTIPPEVVDPSQLQPGDVSPQEQVYVVQPNDGPAKIANLYGITMEQLFAYNAWPEGDAHVFLVGEEVRIPPNSKVPGAAAATPAPPAGGDTGGETVTGGDETATDGDCPTTYVIQSGDTTRIGVADRFGITFQQMDAANANTPGYQNFIVGTPITIPCP